LDDGKAYLRKTCPEHGTFESCIAEKADDFIKWTDHQVINIPPKRPITKGEAGTCPLNCGTCEEHLQTACCVLIDVTKRCNQHCPYCFARAEEDVSLDFSLAEMEQKYDLLLSLGEERPFNIQLSGGEPTVRDDLPEIIKMGRDKGFEYIQINTNGRRIATEEGYAKKLKAAGATVIFMQFDGTTDGIYHTLRAEPLLDLKKKAIQNCRKAGLPVTLVPTIVKNVNLNNIGAMMEFLLDNVDVVKGIHFQPVSFFGRYPDEMCEAGGVHHDFENRVTMFDVMHEMEKQTAGKFAYDDLCPITTGHTLCCFYGTYSKEADGSVKSLISEQTKAAGVGCCCEADPLAVIKKDRDFVLNKWDLPEQSEQDCGCDCDSAKSEESGCCCDGAKSQENDCDCVSTEPEILDFDQFLIQLKRNMFTVSAMAFQDASNLDAERLRRCRVQQLTEDDRLIPFCAYNSIYRGEV